MKKIFTSAALALLAVILALSFISCKKDADVPDGMKKASDEKADFTLFVPEKWTVDLAEAAVGAYCSKSDPSSVSMMAWDLEYTNMTLDEWWETNISEVEKVFSGVEVTSTEDMTVDGLYAKKYVYTATLGGQSYSILQTACIKNATVYLFTYQSMPDTFDLHLDEVGEMLANMRIGR